MINWSYFPRSDKPTDMSLKVVEAFRSVASKIDSSTHDLKSNQVLALLGADLLSLGFRVEAGKAAADKIRVPVLFGRNGKLEKAFDADAYHEPEGFVLEVEAGRGVTNNQFLKACCPASGHGAACETALDGLAGEPDAPDICTAPWAVCDR